MMFVVALAIIAAGLARYLQQPTFWLDEAFVAVSLRSPSFGSIFAPLEYGQFFPRIYLAFIALIREALGYRIWALRLLPFLSFAIGTLLWARLLARKSDRSLLLALMGGGLLIGSALWLDQAIQLKPYTLDVTLSLIVFLLNDQFLDEVFAQGRRKAVTAALASGCFFSYVYPIALGARLIGWYAFRVRRHGWRLDRAAVAMLIGSLILVMGTVWLIDYRFNFARRESYLQYWSACIIHFDRGIDAALHPVAKLLWGWHSRSPLITIGIIPLQSLGIYRAIKTWKNAEEDQSGWGSRSLSGLVVLIGVILASILLSYPLCGRVVLFAEIHTQILALEGAWFVLIVWGKSRVARGFLYAFATVVILYSAHAYMKFNQVGAAEDLRPALSLIDPKVANAIWVHPCSIAQVRALPKSLSLERILLGQDVDIHSTQGNRYKSAAAALEQWRETLHPCTVTQLDESFDPLPVERVLSRGDTDALRERKKAWIVWTHLGNKSCRESLDQIRQQALSWDVIYEGADGGLVLAEF
jgi:hypothetical protein